MKDQFGAVPPSGIIGQFGTYDNNRPDPRDTPGRPRAIQMVQIPGLGLREGAKPWGLLGGC